MRVFTTIQSSLFVLLTTLTVAEAFLDTDQKCQLSIFTPFSTWWNNQTYSAVGLFNVFSNATTIGHSQLAAAIMAAQQFNDRDTSVVADLADLTTDCNVQFDLDNLLVYNSGETRYSASQALFRAETKPCAIVGPYTDRIANQLSVLALAGEIPHVVTRSYSLDVASDYLHPFTSSVYPDLRISARKVADYLLFKGRIDSVAILYDLNDVGPQRFEALKGEFQLRNIGHLGFSFIENIPEFGLDSALFPPLEALREIQNRGFRTIVFCLDDPLVSLQDVADAIVELGMDDGEHFFVFHDQFEPRLYVEEPNENITSVVLGSAWILALPEFHFHPELPFMQSWKNQGDDTVEFLNAINPIQDESSVGYIFAGEDFFQTVEPEYGAGFMFDAVMAVGIGACQAEKAADGTISSAAHQAAIREINFTSSTGRLSFGEDTPDRNGAREDDTVPFVAVNFVTEELGSFASPEIIFPGEQWKSISNTSFIYRDGTTFPPKNLRRPPKQNYLSKGLRIFGFTLMSISMAFGLASGIWVFVCRKHRILAASQPVFLYLICFGTIVQSSSIVTISFDESYGWTKNQLDKSCMAMPWLLCMGYSIIYTSLFTKLWRVNKVLQFSRRKVTLAQVVAPMSILLIGALVILSLWTALDPLTWERDIINSFSGEQVGTCESNHVEAFVAPLVAIILVPTIMTGFMAYKTKDVDDSYTEGWWTFMLITVHVQIIFVSTPVVIILNDISTSGRYLGFLLMMWSFPMSTLCLIFLPKMATYLYAVKGWDANQPAHRRGAQGNSRVTGIDNPMASANKYANNTTTTLLGSTTSAPGGGESRRVSNPETGTSTNWNSATNGSATTIQSPVTSPILAAKADRISTNGEDNASVKEGETAANSEDNAPVKEGETAAI